MDGIILTPLNKIYHPKGEILKAIKKSDTTFNEFGEAYFSTINKGDKSLFKAILPSSFGSWVKAIKELKNSAPNNTRNIMAEVTAVLSITSIKSANLKFLFKTAIRPVPPAPVFVLLL